MANHICQASLSEKETSAHEKVAHVIKYLQNLGPEYLEVIFETSRWVYEVCFEEGLEVCLHIHLNLYCFTYAR